MALDPTILLKADPAFDLGASFRGAADRQRNIESDQRQAQLDQQRIAAGESELRMAQLDEAAKKVDMTNQALARAVDQASYDRERAWLQSQGLDVSKAPPVFDPAFIRQQQMASMDIMDKLKLAREEALNNARIGTEQARAGSYDALTGQRNAAAGSFAALEDQRRAVEPSAGPAPVSAPNMASPSGGLLPPPVIPGTNPSPLPTPNVPIKQFGKPPAGYRFKADGTLEPIPGGPGETISGELAARLGLADDALKQLPTFIDKAKKGQLSGPVDYAMGKSGRGEQGAQYREIDAASEALTRMLTGAGMNIDEARREAALYKPTALDALDPSGKAIASKAEQLQRRLKSVSDVARKGRGGNAEQSAPALDFSQMSDDDIKKALGL